MRRLPIYLLIDTSGSMSGEPIKAMRNGIDLLVQDLRNHPQALETAWLSVITFGGEAKQVVPLTEIQSFKCPELVAGGKAELGAALRLVCECRKRECRKPWKDDNGLWRKGDYRSLVFVFSDGKPQETDLEESIRVFKSERWGSVVCCTLGDSADFTTLKKIAGEYRTINLMSAPSGFLASFFQWIPEHPVFPFENQSVVPTAMAPLPPPIEIV